MISKSKFNSVLTQLKFGICINLLKTKKNPHVKFKIEIDAEFKNYLEKEYQIKGRFKKCMQLLVDFNLITESYYNHNDCHKVKENTFEIKLSNKKNLSITCKKQGTLKTCNISSNPFMTVKFCRFNNVIIDQKERDFLLSIRAKDN